MELNEKAKSIYSLQLYGGKAEIDGVSSSNLRRFHDEGGSMTELLRLADGASAGLDGFDLAQANYSTVEAGVIKAFHLHKRQTDVWFVPPEDRVLLVLVDVRKGSPTEGNSMRVILGDGESSLVRIPPGVAHGCRNIGTATARIIYFTDLQFSPEPGACDEGRLPWDFVGSDIWEVARE